MSKALLLSSGIAFVLFLIIDFFWLSIAVKYIYKPSLGPLLLDKPILSAAFVFYILYIVGLTFLVLRPNIDNFQVFESLWMGALFGLVAYGTYNLTNMAVLKDWSPTVVFVDMFWGGFLTAVSASSGIYLAKKIVHFS